MLNNNKNNSSTQLNWAREWYDYLPYAARLGKIIRYTAYTSDLGEAFRPVVNKWAVRSTYAISWGYVIGDITHEAYKTKDDPKLSSFDWKLNIAKRATFQSIASMALPAFTIHSVVHFSKHKLFPSLLPQYLKWGPTFMGLGVIPFLPYMFDHPVEVGCDRAFDFIHKRWRAGTIEDTQKEQKENPTSGQNKVEIIKPF
jgi:mitochondrial fission process protein 1